MSETRSALLEVDGLTVDIDGRRVLDGVALRLEHGERLAIIGSSGSGKTTLLNVLMGLLPRRAKVSGVVRFEGADLLIADEASWRRRRGAVMALVPQDATSSLDPLVRIGGHVAEAIRAHRQVSRNEARRDAIELLRSVGFDDPGRVARAYPHELSGGMHRRVVVAMSVAHRPRLLLADEPTSSLDPLAQSDVLELLEQRRGAVDAALITVTHDRDVAEQAAANAVTLDAGRITRSGPVADVMPRIRSNARREVVGAGAPACLVVDKLSKQIGDRTLLSQIDLHLKQAETVGVLGVSGAGKTTLARLVAGLLKPTSGRILFDGVDVTSADKSQWRRLRSRLQLVFQDPYRSLDPRYTVGDIVAETLRAQGRWDAEGPLRVTTALQRCGVEGLSDRHPGGLSGGQRQRVGIARAIVCEPALVVMDEPTSSLDAPLRREIAELVCSLQDETGMACLFVTHDVETVAMLSHRVVVLRRGSVVEEGPTGQVLSSPSEAYTHALLGSSL